VNFTDFARTHGVEIANLRCGDRIWRCSTTEHPRSTNGAYFFDGTRGWVQNWETGEPAQWWNDAKAQPWTEVEKRQWAKRREGERLERERNARRAAEIAAELIACASLGEHGYLKSKGLGQCLGLVTPDHVLVVPMRSIDTNELRGAQKISLVENEWRKKFIFGTRAKGAVLRIGPERAAESILVEGYATGLSVDLAARKLCMRAAIYVTFSADNLAHVAQLIGGRRYVIADNDESGTGQRVAEATGLPWAMSERTGEDANDLHQRAGLMAVARLLMACKSTRAGGAQRSGERHALSR